MSAAIEFLRAHRQTLASRLCELVRIASVSAQPGHIADCRRAADWLVGYLNAMGVCARSVETGGHPAVVGEWLNAGPRAPTVLLYGHYDVQPADPIDQWQCPPFDACVRDRDASGHPAREGGVLIARGGADNKGQHLAMLAGVEAHLATSGGLPVNLRVLIEGEEEIGSSHLAEFLAANKEQLACDVIVLADGEKSEGRPAIIYSARGMVYAFITVTGPRQDLHSGIFGGAVANPANGLSRLLAGLHDERGRVTLNGFYDGVDEMSVAQRLDLSGASTGEHETARQAGVDYLGGGEVGRPLRERTWFRPTCDINGITAGYQGPGAKTIIPASASAKVSFRLVGSQDPTAVQRALVDYLEEQCPPGLQVSVSFDHEAWPWRADVSAAPFRAMADAIEAVTMAGPARVGGGGSIPILADMKKILGADAIFLGLARPDCNLHGPNEQFDVSDLWLGAEISAHFWSRLAV